MSNALKKFGGIGVAIVIALAYFGFNTLREKNEAPDVGECVTIGGTLSDADVEDADCGGDDVLYKVVGDDGGCDETELNYTVEVTGSNAVDLCLFYEVAEGDCIKFTDMTSPDEKVDCAENKGEQTVARVLAVDYDSATGSCPKETIEPVKNVTREATICLGVNA